MKLKSIRIINYKSIGDCDNVLSVDRINTIIGKNESGKSNIIEAIAGINLSGITTADFFKQKNKINGSNPAFEIELEPYKDESKEYPYLSNMKMVIKSYFDIEYSGGFEYYVKNDKEFMEAREKILKINKENPIPFSMSSNRDKYNNLLKAITEASKKVFIKMSYMNEIIANIKSSGYADKIELTDSLEFCVNYLNRLHKFFPTFFYLDDNVLQYEYPKKQIIEMKNIEMFENLLKAAKISMDKINEYWDAPDVASRRQIEKEINRLLKENISEPFHEFYSQEKVSIEAVYEDNIIKFLISTTDTFLSYSERSNGLKWYFNLFIKMKAAELDYRNVIYIMDEPGTSLHVNAQKELTKLFEKLSENDNQIIYTTHSPFMIYQENLNYIRPIIKDDQGYTHIYNKYNGISNLDKSRMDTITPVLAAIGMDIKYNLGPSMEKLNLVVEGVSDANYINAYFHQKNLPKEDVPNVIPSVGVSNIDRIISILIGWGCDYYILVDNDKPGRDEYKELINKLCIPPDKIIFTDGTCKYDDKIKHTIECIFSDIDKKMFLNDPNYNDFKNSISRDFLSKIEKNEIKMSEETIKNFDDLFEKILK